MKFPVKVRSLDGIDLEGRPLHLAIGMFDGVHLGHQSVIEAAVQSARRETGIAGVLTFQPHPSVLFRPENPTRLIMNAACKARLFHALGADIVIEQRFDPAFASISPEEFIPYLVERLPTLKSIYVGENWRFGKGRAGDVSLLVKEALRRSINVVSIPRLYCNGKAISSSRIRECLACGHLEEANSLLGYSYFSEGQVREGRQLGRKLGFPTLNLEWAGDLRPRFGVYAVRIAAADAVEAHGIPASGLSCPRVPAVANFGIRPTVTNESEAEPVLEVHLLGDSCPFGPGDRVFVEWLSFLRPENKFESTDALKRQIARDCEDARRCLNEGD